MTSSRLVAELLEANHLSQNSLMTRCLAMIHQAGIPLSGPTRPSEINRDPANHISSIPYNIQIALGDSEGFLSLAISISSLVFIVPLSKHLTPTLAVMSALSQIFPPKPKFTEKGLPDQSDKVLFLFSAPNLSLIFPFEVFHFQSVNNLWHATSRV